MGQSLNSHSIRLYGFPFVLLLSTIFSTDAFARAPLPPNEDPPPPPPQEPLNRYYGYRTYLYKSLIPEDNDPDGPSYFLSSAPVLNQLDPSQGSLGPVSCVPVSFTMIHSAYDSHSPNPNSYSWSNNNIRNVADRYTRAIRYRSDLGTTAAGTVRSAMEGKLRTRGREYPNGGGFSTSAHPNWNDSTFSNMVNAKNAMAINYGHYYQNVMDFGYAKFITYSRNGGHDVALTGIVTALYQLTYFGLPIGTQNPNPFRPILLNDPWGGVRDIKSSASVHSRTFVSPNNVNVTVTAPGGAAVSRSLSTDNCGNTGDATLDCMIEDTSYLPAIEFVDGIN